MASKVEPLRMTNTIFKQTIFISILGHITLFGIFTFSFGPRIPELNFARPCFRGAILPSIDLMNTQKIKGGHKAGVIMRKSETLALDRINRESFWGLNDYSKPPMVLIFNKDKMAFKHKISSKLLIPKRKESTIMFYPKLPYRYALYFKDRQVAHIELLFEVVSSGEKSSVVVKRRISSGNLEVDLLTMRYISRYLFVQQISSLPDEWQTVKIDLSAKEY